MDGNAYNRLENLADNEEIGRFDEALQGFLLGVTDAERFTAIRLQHGVYGQRQEGVNMVRIKLPGGRLDPARLKAVADVLDRYVEGASAHITTRQDIQVHFLPLPHAPAALRRLAEAGLTTREACGNTIRNITACPLAGACPREHTDVTTHLGGAVTHFLRNPLNQQLPRKFKISFSGCEADCAQGLIHDLSIVAVRRDGRFGFRVSAGGGLGHKPHEAIVIEPFIEERDLLPVMEAVVALHNRYSDRTKRAKSRIKFLVDRFGPEDFIEKYREELARVRAALAHGEHPAGEWQAGQDSEIPGPGVPRALFAQKQPGLYVFPLAVPLGQITATQLRGLASLLEGLALSDVRTTQDQNLMVLGVPQSRVGALRAGAAALGLREPKAGDNVVACPGTSSCRLGITASPTLGGKLSGGADDLRIRVSGCHNGCAQPETGDIGIYGEGRRLHGRLIPHYQTYFGGSGLAGGGLAIKGPSIPSARIQVALDRVRDAFAAERQGAESFFAWTRRKGEAGFQELLADLTQVSERELPSVLRDHGEKQEFKVLQLGGGECAGASQSRIGASFFEAARERQYRDTLFNHRKYGEAAKGAEAILRVLGQGLTQFLKGKRSESLPEIAAEVARLHPGSIAEEFAHFAGALERDPEDWADAELKALFAAIDAWTVAVGELLSSRDRQLDIGEALPRVVPAATRPAAVAA
jgi:sulfite reductase (NADPH) hemoprotein beta-component